MIKIAISGSMGKMGTRIRTLAEGDDSLAVSVLLERKSHDSIGESLNGIKISEDIAQVKNSDVLIEFTSPESTIVNLKQCVKLNKPIVIGTTGLSVEQIEQIKECSKQVPVVFSPNMSVGVNLLFILLKEAATNLKEYDVKITEAHHVHKKDAPSGTAKRLANIIESETKKKVDNIESIREGEIVGDHEIVFESDVDTIKLSHSAKTRDIFAQGALVAAKFLVGKKSGLYDMQDVLAEVK